MKMSLYEMTNDLTELMSIPEEEITEEIRQEIVDSIMQMIKNKSENTIKYIRNLETRIDALKSEEKRMKEYRQLEEKKYENLKNYFIECLNRAGLKTLDTNLGKISLRKSPASVEADIKLIPKKYIVEEIVQKVDKNSLKKTLKEGVHIEGARLIEDKYTLGVK